MTPVKTIAMLFVAAGLLTTEIQGARGQAPTVDPKADDLLRKMSAALGDMKAFRFDADHATEVVTREGQKIQLLAKSSVAVERPDKLRSERVGPLADVVFTYDGERILLYGKRVDMYATSEAPPTLDRMIDFARDDLDLDAPAADLLYRDAYAGLMEDVVSGRYLGTEEVGDRSCHHLAYRARESDWQIWIEDGPRPLPCRYVITSKKVAGSPQYTIELGNWRVAAKWPDSTFVFTPPSSARKIDFFGKSKRKKEER